MAYNLDNRPELSWFRGLIAVVTVNALIQGSLGIDFSLSHPPFLIFLAVVVAAGIVVAVREQLARAGRDLLRRERKQSDARAIESDQLYRAVLEALPAHVAVLNSDGVIVATNSAWDRFGAENKAMSSFVGGSYLEACQNGSNVDEDPIQSVAQGIRDVLEGRREQFSTEYPCHAADVERWFLMIVTPLAGAHGRQHGAVVAHLDISERKRAESAAHKRAEELAAMAAALKRGNEELDQFAYITSHDLRAPLRGIANLSRWIEEDMGDRFTPEAHQQMDLLRGRVERMEDMIDGILEYSRAGRVKSAVEPIDVAKTIADVVELLDPPPRVSIDVAAGMPCFRGEKLRFSQVMQNLIGNAIKHGTGPGGGAIRVSCRPTSDGFHEFCIADNGSGIDPRYHDKIFMIFSTLQPRDKVEGTGVGLALVRKIVQEANGKVWVESSLGAGARFYFTWPAEPGASTGRSGTRPDQTGAAAVASSPPADTEFHHAVQNEAPNSAQSVAGSE